MKDDKNSKYKYLTVAFSVNEHTLLIFSRRSGSFNEWIEEISVAIDLPFKHLQISFKGLQYTSGYVMFSWSELKEKCIVNDTH